MIECAPIIIRNIPQVVFTLYIVGTGQLYNSLDPLAGVTTEGVGGDKLIVTYLNGTGYFTHSGTEWSYITFNESIYVPPVSFEDLTDLPACFLPCEHTHEVEDINGLEDYIESLVPEVGEVNVQANWNETNPLEDSFILNKPTIPSTYTHPNHTGDVTSTGDGATVIANDAVTTAKILNNSVTTAKLGPDAVITSKILDYAVTSAKLATSGVTAGSYTSPNLTISDKGIVTAATSVILPLELDILVVAGGGGGGISDFGRAGGGGGGGVTRGSYLCPLVQNSKIAVSVGAGGSTTSNGENSYFLSSSVLQALGGKDSGFDIEVGGDAGHYTTNPNLIFPALIYSTYQGGSGFGVSNSGGGATAAGSSGNTALGGAGLTINFSGTSATYGRGGASYADVTTPLDGEANTGAGGKGARNLGASGVGSAVSGGTGGSGIVIVRYLSPTAKFSGGAITTFGSYQVHTFLTSGELTIL